MSNLEYKRLTEAVMFSIRCLERGRSRPVDSNKIDIDGKFNSEHILSMSKRLSLEEIEVLFSATAAREAALDFIRADAFQDGRKELARAESIVDSNVLSDEGMMIAKSFQLAAEAYLRFRQKEYDQAAHCLRHAVCVCGQLGAHYPVEVRRIHLATNVVRVFSCAGKHNAALDIVTSLLAYFCGDDDAWPFKESRIPARQPLEKLMKWGLLDQIFKETSRIQGAFSLSSFGLSSSIRPDLCNEFPQVVHWIKAIEYFETHDQRGFFLEAGNFFESGRAELPNAWSTLIKTYEVMIKSNAPQTAKALKSAGLI